MAINTRSDTNDVWRPFSDSNPRPHPHRLSLVNTDGTVYNLADAILGYGFDFNEDEVSDNG